MLQSLSRLMPFLSRQLTCILGDEKMMGELKKQQFDLAIVDNLFMLRHMYLIPARLGIM